MTERPTYRIRFRDDELSHSGILGMKWGQRNGPPYPLKSSQKSSAEKAAAKNVHSFRLYTSLDKKTVANTNRNATIRAKQRALEATKRKEEAAIRKEKADKFKAELGDKYKAYKEKRAAKKEEKKKLAREKELIDIKNIRKRAREMTSDELAAAIKRLQDQKTYYDLMASGKVMGPGENWVTNALNTLGRNALPEFLTSAGKNVADAAVKSLGLNASGNNNKQNKDNNDKKKNDKK